MAFGVDLSALDLHRSLVAAPLHPQQPGSTRKLQYKGTNRISAKDLPRRQRVLGPDPGVGSRAACGFVSAKGKLRDRLFLLREAFQLKSSVLTNTHHCHLSF